MCERAVEENQQLLEDIPDHFKTQKIFERAVCLVPSFLQSIPDHLKTQEICDDAVCRDLFFLQFIPDYFVTQQQLKIWHDYNVYYYDDKLIEWYNGYKKKKAQKASIKEELMPIAWHLSRWWDWYMSKEEKKGTEKLWAQAWSFFSLHKI